MINFLICLSLSCEYNCFVKNKRYFKMSQLSYFTSDFDEIFSVMFVWFFSFYSNRLFVGVDLSFKRLMRSRRAAESFFFSFSGLKKWHSKVCNHFSFIRSPQMGWITLFSTMIVLRGPWTTIFDLIWFIVFFCIHFIRIMHFQQKWSTI